MQRVGGQQVRRVHRSGQIAMRADSRYSRHSLAASCTSSGRRQLLMSRRPKRASNSVTRSAKLRASMTVRCRDSNPDENLQREGGASAVHQRSQKCAFDLLAPLAGDLFGP